MRHVWHSWMIRIGWLMALGVLLAVFGGFWWAANTAQRGIAFAPPPEPLPWTNVEQGGINLPAIHLEQPDVISQTFQTAHAAGFRWARVQFPWEDIEIHAKGDFRDYRHDYNGDGVTDERDAISAWAKYDALVETAAAFDIQLIVRLDRPPDWARQNLPSEPFRVEKRNADPGATGPPDDYADYGDYVEAVVGRYKGKVRFFQLWNEPNYGHEWNWADPNPDDFVKLLKLGYSRAKHANPDAVILFPSLTPADGLDWEAKSDLAYLDRVYELGGGAYFDIFSAQLYGLGQPATENRYVRPIFNAQGRPRTDLLWSRPLDSRTDVTRAVLLREIMEYHGDTHKPVWISEFGWNDWPSSHPFGLPVTSEQKARYLVELMQRARHEWPWIGVMNVWFLRPGAGFNPQDPTLGFALVEADWTPTAAYTAVQAYLNSPAEVGVGIYAAGHPAIEQTGAGWSLRFFGSGYSVEPVPLVLTLDGAPAAAQADDLALGSHILEGEGQPPRIRISRSNPWRLAWILAPFALLIGLIGVIHKGLMRFGRH